MTNILQKIYNHKVELVKYQRSKQSQKDLERIVKDCENTRGFINKIKVNAKNNRPSIIAEIKKAT